MNTRTTPANRPYGGCNRGEERRYKARVYEPYAVRVQGTDPTGSLFEINTVLENLSTSGLYLRMAKPVEKGDKLSIRIKIPPVSDDTAPGLHVAASGEVQRIDRLDNDTLGVAVRFTRHRVL